MNLDNRTDKWEQCREQFDKMGMIVERFSAIDGSTLDMSGISDAHTPNRLACRISQLNIFLDAKEHQYKNFLLLEDDIEFYYDFRKYYGTVA